MNFSKHLHLFWRLAATAAEEREGNTATESLAAAQAEAWVTPPKNSTVMAQVRENNIM